MPRSSKGGGRGGFSADGARSAAQGAGGRASGRQPSSSLGSSRSSATRRTAERSQRRPSQSLPPRSPQRTVPPSGRPPKGQARKTGLGEKILTSKPALLVIALVVLVGGLFAWDSASNWQRAYAGVTVGGVDVGGMDREEMNQALHNAFGPAVSQGQVTIYASEEDRSAGQEALAATREAVEGDHGFDASASQEDVSHWVVDARALKATVPYDQAIDAALAVGREDGGYMERLNLAAEDRDIPLTMEFDPVALEEVALQIDQAAGDARTDATVTIQNAYATTVEGHDGTMADRQWLAEQLSSTLLEGSKDATLVAKLTQAPSRITLQQAEQTAAAINHALGCDASFTYKDRSCIASDVDLGMWTRVDCVADGDGFKLQPSIDAAVAIPVIADGAQAHVNGEDTQVTFEKTTEGMMVRTTGKGKLPDVASAVGQLNDQLYGPQGIAWTDQQPHTLTFTIGESDIPSTLTFDEALDMGVITAIGTFTTEFSNYVGTENRNHNIKLAADILNDSIVDADGGTWSFNETAGDTNEEAGFWSAGSIVEGEITDSIGGGICQVATTIFNAVYEAGLKVPLRYNHTLYMANYPDGRDAAVTYPEMDLEWVNDLTSDILLRLSYTDTSVTATLYSLWTGMTVESDVGEWKDGEKYSTRFKTDDTMASGAYYKQTSGWDGSKITVTRTVKDRDGKLVRTDAFQSVYDPKDEVYVVGPDTDTAPLKRTVEEDDDDDDDSATNGGSLDG